MSQNYIVTNKTSAAFADVLFELKKLDRLYFPTPWDTESWDHIFSAEIDRLIIVDKTLDVVRGFILFEANVVDSFAHLLKILVAPEYRGVKVGASLLREAIRILSEQKIQNFFLEVEEDNLIARGLYESMGFKVIHKKKHFYSNGANAIIMTLTA